MIKEIVNQYIAPLMKVHDFKKKGLLWNRQHDDIVHVVQFQKSSWNTKGECSFTINIGIWVKEIWEIMWDEKRSGMIGEADCFPRFRIGELLEHCDSVQDVWWTVNPRDSIDDTGVEVQKALEDKVIPLLDQCTTIANVAVIAESQTRQSPADKIAYAILHYINGQCNIAIDIIAGLEANLKSKAWNHHIQKVKKQIMLNPGGYG